MTEGQIALDLLRRIAEALERAYPNQDPAPLSISTLRQMLDAMPVAKEKPHATDAR